MSVLNSIREKSGQLILKRESSRLQRKKKIINLEDAGRIGVVYFLPDEPTYRKISDYVKK